MVTARSVALAAFAQHRCSAILRTDDAAVVRPALDAARAGGFRILEVTLTTPGALQHVAALAKDPEVLVGAGTVLTIDDAKAAMAAGAKFLVSPVTDPQIISFCRQHDLLSVPGAYTPTEMMMAHRAGADIVKLFPGPANGPEFLKAVRGPLPFLKIFPTSGVTEENADAWLAAGAFGLGFVGSLFVPDDLANRRFEVLRARAARLVAKVAAYAPVAVRAAGVPAAAAAL